MLTLIALDVGEKRIGVATASGDVRIAVPVGFIEVDGGEIDKISRLVEEYSAKKLIIGLPRNSSGELTLQSEFVQKFAKKLEPIGIDIIFQDESLTSVKAEEYLQSSGKKYEKGDIDARAAALILQDYLERNAV